MHPSVLLVLLGLSLGLATAFPAQEPDGGKHWVLIVAGSNGWYNYRHQVRLQTAPTMSPDQSCFHSLVSDKICVAL